MRSAPKAIHGTVLAEERHRVPTHITSRKNIMGKYVLGWFLGVPVVVLVLLYLLFH